MIFIGGYFELGLRKGEHYHKNAIRFNTARNCFKYVLRARHYRKVYLPYYTCEVMMEPINKLGISFEFYPINLSLEPVELPALKEEEAFVYTNYFGLKQDCVKRLAEVYGPQLMVDNAQAFYAEPIQGVDTFYSARKFFGVSDGAYLYIDKPLHQDFIQDCSYERMSHLLKRIDLGAEAGYYDFQNNEDALCNEGIKRMSKLTEAVLAGIDYEEARKKRIENYQQLEEALGATNRLYLKSDAEGVPMIYPYLAEDHTLKQNLIKHKVFVATYWSNVKDWTTDNMLESALADNLIPIPCDQRYGQPEIDHIIDIIIHGSRT